jgi:hypothetical protein
VSAAVHGSPPSRGHPLVRERDERRDGRGVGRVEDVGGGDPVERPRRGRQGLEGLDVRRVAARGAHEGVLADRARVQELLAARAAHRARVGGDDRVVEPEPLEDPLVRVPLQLVGGGEPVVVDVEGVGVLHRELAAAQEPGARPRLVPVLVLDLVDRQRQVLVRGVEVLHEQREDLLVRRREQVVVALAVLQREDAVAVLRPAARGLVGSAREHGREVDLLGAGRLHLLAHDRLDAGLDAEPERQPGEEAGTLTPDVAGAHEQLVAGHLGVGRVLTQRAEEQPTHARDHGPEAYRRGTEALHGPDVAPAPIDASIRAGPKRAFGPR